MFSSPPQSLNRFRTLLCIVATLASGAQNTALFAATHHAPVVIAIVDDGWVPELGIFDGMRWQNPGEIANNNKDDDGNGRIDDLIGWDVSDQDENVTPPAARLSEYSHGTYMAAQIAKVIRQNLGEMDDYPIKLMFVKAISDTATRLHVKDGYLGLQTALEYNADVINLSWSGGVLNSAATKALASARNKDILVVGAVGTYAQKEPSFPAAHPAVLGVAGIDTDKQLFMSNYGEEVDIAASSAGYPERLLGDDSPENVAGVSNAAALVSATVALMKNANPAASNRQIKHCMQQTAIPLDEFNADYAGLIGAGGLDTASAIQCVQRKTGQAFEFTASPKGSLAYSHTGALKQTQREWIIAPVGRYAGLSLKPFFEGRPNKSTLSIYAHTPGIKASDENALIWDGLLSDIPARIATERSAIKLQLNTRSNRAFYFHTRFSTQNIDQSARFCSGQTELVVDEKTPITLSDGSGSEDYANHTDCKWALTAIPGHDLVLKFLELDTELGFDSIYLFRGETTEQRGLLMQISGKELPPKIVIEGGAALLWFVSSADESGAGFRLEISTTPRQLRADES